MGLGFGLLSAQLRPGEADWSRGHDETVRIAVEAERLGLHDRVTMRSSLAARALQLDRVQQLEVT